MNSIELSTTPSEIKKRFPNDFKIIKDKWGNLWQFKDGKTHIIWLNDKQMIRKQKIKKIYGRN